MIIVPRVLAKVEGGKREPTLARARTLRVPVVEDAELAESIFENHATGNDLKRDYFEPVVRILADLKILKV